MGRGTTAFSFTNEWLSGRFTLELLLRRTAQLDLGPGIELIGFQTWRGFPELPSDELVAFRRLVDELGLEPAALGGYADVARRVDRPMTTGEAVEFLRPQIAVAQALGFPMLRLHGGIPTAVLERLAPVAERAGVTLATEVQGAQRPDDPAVAALLECHDRIGSASLALALDFSVAMVAVPAAFADTAVRLGLAPDALDALVALWSQGASQRQLLGAIGDVDAPDAALAEVRAGFFRFGHGDPQEWLPHVPRIAYAHAKFWETDEDGADPTVRTAELVDVLAQGGFDGVVACEWGGNAWLDAEDADAFELVRRHHAHCRALVSGAAVPAS
jgi:Xylose isomerase-like TIM barrel